MRRGVFLVAVLAVLLCPAVAHAGRGMFVGIDDNTLKWMHRPNGIVGVDHQLGVDTTRITIPWRRGETRPRPVAQVYLNRAARAIVLGQRIVLAIYGHASAAPTERRWRLQYCSDVRHILARIPQIAGVVIWNEANSPRYWPQRAGAPAYEKLLATCWDMLHGLRHPVNVIDSTASHYDPAAFIARLGTAYRDSGRTRPITDTFGHNPYPETAAEQPWVTHTNGSIGEGDYETLVRAITEAFLFTGQPVPTASKPILWYLEDGFQTSVPASLRHLYSGKETDRSVIPATATSAPNQAAQLRSAVELAYCQPAVGAFFNFELIDEHRLAGWQSGLLYTNGTPKPSFAAFQQVVSDVADHTIDCANVKGAPPQGLEPIGP